MVESILSEASATRSNKRLNMPMLFVGNGPYRNRGCEAIVRGTMEILADQFGPHLRARAGVMASPETVQDQAATEIDQRVENFPVSYIGARFSAKWWLSQANKRVGTNFHPHVRDLAPYSENVSCALQLGGDNYSLDYGRPWDYFAVDNYLIAKGIPVVLWGASVGPFDRDPRFAPTAHEHLRRLDAIFVRETATQDYLSRHGVRDNVHLVADPAFCMTPEPPDCNNLRGLATKETIGINISPLVSRFIERDGGLNTWRKDVAQMIVEVAKRLPNPILLIPHVGSPNPDEDDFSFMLSVGELVKAQIKTPISVVPPGLNAAEMKWIIGNCRVFAGARTHSTIAALSSCVPTLSLSYSVKAVGINNDIFGHQEFCQPAKSITAAGFADCVERLVADTDQIAAHLEEKIPEIKARARFAGSILAEIINSI